MEPIKKLISVAKEEVGYIEKNSINNLYDKNLNIGFNNYTKYWQDIEPNIKVIHGVQPLLIGAF